MTAQHKVRSGGRRRSRPGGAPYADDRGSTIPLIIAFFIISGLMLVAGVMASAAFLAQRELQASCDGAAVAAADGLERASIELGGGSLAFNKQAAANAAADYLAVSWGAEFATVSMQVALTPGRVVVLCTRTAQLPFQELIYPDGITQTVEAGADSPLLG